MASITNNILLLLLTLATFNMPMYAKDTSSYASSGLQARQATADGAPEKEENPKSYEENIYDGLRTFAQIIHIVDQRHYKVHDAKECLDKAMEAFVNCLDPHSAFLNPKHYKQMLESTSGEFFGIGVIIDNTRLQKDKFLMIIDTIPDGPADKAGLKPLDKIIEISGEALENMTTDEAMRKIKGERNTKVNLKITREGQIDPLSFDITRDAIKEQNSLCFHLAEHDIYYIALTMFSETAMKHIEELLKKSKEKKYKALIIDLRNNSGGLLTSVVDIAGLFLDKGSLVVTTKNKEGKETRRYSTTRAPIAAPVPIFILINNYTASAAEILAGCLKLHSQAITNKGGKNPMVFLVGTKTFGKGSVQDVIPIGNNCAVKITESLYFLPGDVSIQAEGITPDFEVEKSFPPTEQMLWIKKFYGSESTLSNYIKNGNGKEKDKKEEKKDDKQLSWLERAKKALENDNQLRETINLINIHSFGQAAFPDKVATRQKAVDFMNNVDVTNKPLKLQEVVLDKK